MPLNYNILKQLKKYKLFYYSLLIYFSNILVGQESIQITPFSSNNIEGALVKSSISDDLPLESIYSMRTEWDNVNKEINSKTLGMSDINKGITTRQITGAGRLYKKCAPGVVILSSLDANSMGSGAIISGKGEIITNWHVIEGQDKMLVWIYNSNITSRKDLDPDSYLIAKVIAEDQTRDLAMLVIENKTNSLVTIPLGRDYELNIADDVFAIGHPENYIWSFTYGVISQIRKDWDWTYGDNQKFTADVIQTQTPTNPGNSGGPLFNDAGKLVGINTFGSDGQGLNFAVTVGEVRTFISDARNGKYEPSERLVSWESFDKNDNGVPDYYLRDVDNDGKYDVSKTDENEDGVIDYYGLDTNGDQKPDILIFDDDNNGSFEYYLIDENYDGTFDQIGIDTNGDREPDQYFPYEE
jgi:S1-C subfamily serine protease